MKSRTHLSWNEHVDAVLSSDLENEQNRAHLEECSSCQAVRQELSDLVQIMEARQQLRPVTRETRQAVFSAIQSELSARHAPTTGLSASGAGRTPHRLVAKLVHPTRELALRGAESGLRRTYETDALRIVIAEFQADEGGSLRGHVYIRSESMEMPRSGTIHGVVSDSDFEIDETGEFFIDPVPDGTDSLTISAPTCTVELDLLER